MAWSIIVINNPHFVKFNTYLQQYSDKFKWLFPAFQYTNWEDSPNNYKESKSQLIITLKLIPDKTAIKHQIPILNCLIEGRPKLVITIQNFNIWEALHLLVGFSSTLTLRLYHMAITHQMYVPNYVFHNPAVANGTEFPATETRPLTESNISCL